VKLLAGLAALLALAGCQPDAPAPSPDAAPEPSADADCVDDFPCEDTEAIRLMGFPIAVPGYLPDGAEVAEMVMVPGDTSLDAQTGEDLAYYWWHYRAGNVCFTVEGGVVEGLGGPQPEFSSDPVEAAGFVPFGEGTDVRVWWNGPTPEEGLYPNDLRSDFLATSSSTDIGYRLTSTAGPFPDPDHYYQQEADCEMLDPEVARRIIASFVILDGTAR